MQAVAFDTFEAAKRLRNAGFNEDQTEALVGAFASNILEGLASKQDIEHVEASLHKDIVHLEESIRKDMTQLEESIRKDMTQLEESIRKDMTQLEDRMDVKFESIQKDIVHLEESIRKDMAHMKDELNGQISRMSVRFGGIVIAVVGAFSLLNTYFLHGG